MSVCCHLSLLLKESLREAKATLYLTLVKLQIVFLDTVFVLDQEFETAILDVELLYLNICKSPHCCNFVMMPHSGETTSRVT